MRGKRRARTRKIRKCLEEQEQEQEGGLGAEGGARKGEGPEGGGGEEGGAGER